MAAAAVEGNVNNNNNGGGKAERNGGAMNKSNEQEPSTMNQWKNRGKISNEDRKNLQRQQRQRWRESGARWWSNEQEHNEPMEE